MKPYAVECAETCVHQQVVDRMKEEALSQDEYHHLASIFKMFADPTRLKILHLLFQEPLCVCDIASILDMSHSAISHQLAILRQHRIIKYERKGKNVMYSLDDLHIQAIFKAGYQHMIE